MNIHERLTDPGKHPRLAFLVEYVEGLAVIVLVYFLTRAAYATVLWIDQILPATGPHDVHWYLPISFSRTLVTIIDMVALLFVTITSVVGIVRLVAVLFWPTSVAKDSA